MIIVARVFKGIETIIMSGNLKVELTTGESNCKTSWAVFTLFVTTSFARSVVRYALRKGRFTLFV